jgi:hypothetical protein
MGFAFGSFSSFILDWRRALKGLLIAILVAVGFYLLGVYMKLL